MRLAPIDHVTQTSENSRTFSHVRVIKEAGAAAPPPITALHFGLHIKAFKRSLQLAN